MNRFRYVICVLLSLLMIIRSGYTYTNSLVPVLHIDWGTQIYGISADSVVISHGIVKPIVMDANQGTE